MVKCQHCGTQNRADATYCNSCGYALKGSTVVHPAASAVRGPAATPLHPTGRLPAQSRLAGVYIITRSIGQGGMAAVYQATDIRNNSQVAIKEMSQDSLAPSELQEALTAFVQEAEMLMGLRHKGLPRVSGHFSEGSRHYLVMEYIEGQTLEQRQTAAGGKALPERDVLAWADQICDVLTYLHNRRPPIIFRDLKPANIMVTSNGRIKLIDFGIARVFVPGRTRDTQVLGTPGFAPPEQYGKAQTDPRADVYALGCTMYQLLSGYDPASTPFALPPLHTRNPDVSPHVQVAIERATKLDREGRFRSAADFQRMLIHPEGMYFRTGECAHSLRELLALCQAHPQEAAEHLYTRRFDPWLSRWGERQAIKAVLTSTMRTGDKAAGLAAFIKTAAAPAASAASAASATSTTARPGAQANRQHPGQQSRAGQSARGTTTHAAASAAPSATASLVMVEPRTIDFGQLKAGQRGTLSITVRGQNGASVSGQLIPPPAWIGVDKTSFNGPSTLVQLTAETAGISAPGKQYSSLQIITGSQHIYVPITAEIVRAPRATTAPQSNSPYATKVHAAVHAKAQSKHAAPPLGRPLNLGFLGGLVLALGLSVATLQFLPSLLAMWAPGMVIAGPLMVALLALVALVTLPGALIGSGGRGWPGRINTTLVGALIGLLIVLMAERSVLLPGFTLPSGGQTLAMAAQPIWANARLFAGHANLPVALLLGAAIMSLSATLGSQRVCSSIMLRIGAFFRRFSAVFSVLGGIVAGGAAAGWLASGLPYLVPIAVVTGAILGGIICGRINQLFESLTKSRYMNQPVRKPGAGAGRPRTRGYP